MSVGGAPEQVGGSPGRRFHTSHDARSGKCSPPTFTPYESSAVNSFTFQVLQCIQVSATAAPGRCGQLATDSTSSVARKPANLERRRRRGNWYGRKRCCPKVFLDITEVDRKVYSCMGRFLIELWPHKQSPRRAPRIFERSLHWRARPLDSGCAAALVFLGLHGHRLHGHRPGLLRFTDIQSSPSVLASAHDQVRAQTEL